ncbi:rhamnulokinase [Zhihengliuella halotolerans]|uniref:Rhamnulokinase n=2 Tax=Zhihengliuella halotolerans TaxID=370736 RepID=A0A4Q8AIB4_9MICC|nr:rhamnulokinase [Zhihengliuella halotolerans]
MSTTTPTPVPGTASPPVMIAVDIGASSGRVIIGRLPAASGQAAGTLEMEVVHRFPNGVTEIDGSLHWDAEAIFAQVQAGLEAAGAVVRENGERVVSIGIDTWAVDYGLLDAEGELIAAPHAYRDARTDAVIERVHATVSPERLYAIGGMQFLPFNTVYQLAAEVDLAGKRALMIPDLLAYWLTGVERTEETNASTTALFDARAVAWSPEVFDAIDAPQLFAELIAPGESYGRLLPEVAAATGLDPAVEVVAVGSHDTASAVAAVPADDEDFAYVSSGTWSLVGLELDGPVLSQASRAANFTNERGVDGTIRYLQNVGGLWLLQESMRDWAGQGRGRELTHLLAGAAALPAGPVVDANSSEFIAPGGMAGRIRAAVEAAGGSLPAAPAEPGSGVDADQAATVRCIMDSLAAGYAASLRTAAELAGKRPAVVHIVGGGSQNSLLCQLTANATGLPVIAGPVEATAQGNLLVQARAAGLIEGGLTQLRAAIAVDPVRYEPQQ